MELIRSRFPHSTGLLRLILCGTLLLSTGCVERKVDLAQVPVPKVTVSQPLKRELGQFGEYTGQVEAVDNVEIRARVTGYLNEVKYVEGDLVEQGAELFKIDPRPFEAVLEAANAEVERWHSQIVKTQADLDRQLKLQAKSATTQEDVDSAKAARLNADASLKKAEAAVVSAELDVEFTSIRSPVKGRVSRALITKGNLVTADQSLGTPLTTVISVDPMYVYFDVDEYTILELMNRTREEEAGEKPDDAHVRDRKIPVSISLANETGFPHEGVLDFVDNRVDQQTGTLRARARFDNSKEFLVAGLFVRVRIPLGKPKQQLLVPEVAIGSDLNLQYVLVVNEKNIVEKRPVTLGIRTDDNLRAVLTGLGPEDWVITNGISAARETFPVEAEKKPIIDEKSGDDEKPAAGAPEEKAP